MGQSTGRTNFTAIAAATVGNAFEWFDLIVYGFFAAQIGAAYFPSEVPGASVLIALATFGVAYLMRPLGGIVLGAYADRAGRKKALVLGMSLMMIGVGLIALTPTHAQIGMAAPVIIVFARLLQGFSAGGEFASATAFLAEQTKDRRAYYASFQFSSQGFALLLAALFGAGLTHVLPPADVESYGWRIPFLFGLLVGPAALYIRRFAHETPEFAAAHPKVNPLADALSRRKAAILAGLGLVVMGTVTAYMLIFMPTYAVDPLGLGQEQAFVASITSGVILTIGAPLFGLLADRKGRLAVALPAAALLALLAVPMFAWLAAAPSLSRLIAAQVVVSILQAAYLGALPSLIVDLFPVESRSTGAALSYNIAVMAFGGLSPVAIKWLIDATGWVAAPGWYLAAAAALSAVTAIVLRARGEG